MPYLDFEKGSLRLPFFMPAPHAWDNHQILRNNKVATGC
ncbi:Uncharacterized protein ChrSV_3669 [Chromobacterium vaccinii]|nr:Uncharacterized protein ChrSW_3669 [Chromobacterium vaccinii]QND91126.1 Uncharacterized protein ChrSV_3669 [Chromobacterium vaccinii]